MSRAAILAAGATLAVAGAACDSDPPKNADAGQDATSMSDVSGGDGAGNEDTGGGNTNDSAANDRGIVALYGVAPVPEYGAVPPQTTPDNG